MVFVFLLAPFLHDELLELLLVLSGHVTWVIVYLGEAFHVLLSDEDIGVNAALKIVEEVFINVCIYLQILFTLYAQRPRVKFHLEHTGNLREIALLLYINSHDLGENVHSLASPALARSLAETTVSSLLNAGVFQNATIADKPVADGSGVGVRQAEVTEVGMHELLVDSCASLVQYCAAVNIGVGQDCVRQGRGSEGVIALLHFDLLVQVR